MINSVTLIGHAGHDPQIFELRSGKSMAKFSLACNERWGTPDERRERTHWIDCVAYGSMAKVCEHYVHKGSKLGITGSLCYSEWKDAEDGGRKSRLEVKIFNMEFLTPRS